MSAFNEVTAVSSDYPIRIHKITESFSFPPHYHRALEVIYVIEGHLRVVIDHHIYDLEPYDLLIIGSNHIHSLERDACPNTQFYMTIFDWNHLESIYKDGALFSQISPIIVKNQLFNNAKNFEPLFNAMETEAITKDTGYKLAIMSHLYQFLIMATRLHQSDMKQDTTDLKLKKEHQFITKANQYIYEHYQAPMTLLDIATATGYSTYHFSRRFRAYMGTTFKTYLTNFRITMVKEDLYDDAITITEAAYKNGFSSIKTFNRCFKEITGIAPRDYKKAFNDHS